MANYFENYYKSAHKNHYYVAAEACLEIAKNLEDAMTHRGISKSELADLLGCSKPYVTKILRGDANLTIETMAKLSVALDCHLTTKITCNEHYEFSPETYFEIFRLCETMTKEVESLGQKVDAIYAASIHASRFKQENTEQGTKALGHFFNNVINMEDYKLLCA